ncbi:MAG TPA: hypothetical protein VH163_11485 [Gemmatimonadales bacterium]|nr:hypothetical protein [Gemmatimonadales bacterium]
MTKIRYVMAIAAGLGTAVTAVSAQLPDTVVAFRGIVMRDTGSAWGLFMPVPIQVGTVRFNFLHLAGKVSGIDRNENRYAELRGHILVDDAGRPSLEVNKLHVMSVPGEGDRTVARSFMEHVEVATGILPNLIVFSSDSAAGRVRTRPVITFAITNHSDEPMDFNFRNNKLVCASVLPSNRSVEPVWAGSWSVGPYLTSLKINLSATVSEAVTLPDSVTFPPGHYRLRTWLCEATDYSAETSFDVALQ